LYGSLRKASILINNIFIIIEFDKKYNLSLNLMALN
jgi:hypothetical protein